MKNETPKKKVHKKNGIILKIIIFVVILSIFVFWAFNSTFFNIETINIDNSKTLKKKNILKESKIIKDTNIFKFKTADTEENLKQNAFIKSAEVKRKLPNTVNIDIKERERTFILQYISMYFVVDEEGFIMEELEVPDGNLSIIKGFNTKFTKPGETIFLKEENESLKSFINEAKTLKILNKMEEVEKDFANDVNIKLKDGIYVAFGTLSNVKYKLSLLKEIMENIEEKDIKAKKIIMNKGSHPILILDD